MDSWMVFSRFHISEDDCDGRQLIQMPVADFKSELSDVILAT